ncbi:MAG: guanylate kinase, partial [Pyrinomonadaceae bacterium]
FTTRAIREGENDGRDYFFVSPEEFEKRIRRDEFLEFANVHGNFYGTSHQQVERETASGNDVILEIDVQGAESIRKMAPQAVQIFILPPSFGVLRERLIRRQTENENDLSLRLLNAHTEVKCYKEFDYVVINDELIKATADLQAIICAERLKCERQESKISKIIKTFENFKTNSYGD